MLYKITPEILADKLNNGSALSAIQLWVDDIADIIDLLKKVEDSSQSDRLNLVKGRLCSMAFTLLIQQPEHPRPCPFLSVFGADRSEDREELMKCDGPVAKLIGSQDEVFWESEIVSGANSLLSKLSFLTTFDFRGVELRLATLMMAWHAMSQKEEPEVSSLANKFLKLVKGYQDYFSTEHWSNVASNAKCASFHHLRESKNRAANLVAQAIEMVTESKKLSHLDPAIAFVCASLSMALDPPKEVTEPVGHSWRAGDSWIILGNENATSMNGTGLVLKLRVEKGFLGNETNVGTCAGAVFPHPLFQAFSRLDEDFQIGTLNAWLAAIDKRALRCDFTWQVAPMGLSRGVKNLGFEVYPSGGDLFRYTARSCSRKVGRFSWRFGNGNGYT